MIRDRRIQVLAAGFTILLSGAGCLRRKETISVSADGSVSIGLEYRGKPEVWDTLDALPSQHSGWDVVESTEREGNDEEKVIRSTRRFSPGEPLPSTFAATSDPDREIYLHFPTTLTREKRGDATYYHLRRVYPARLWAFVQAWHDAAFEGNAEKIAEKKPEELTSEERTELMKAFAKFEAMKQIEFASAAWRKAMRAVPQDHWLIARAALLDSYEEINYDELAGLFARSENQDELLTNEAERIVRRGLERFIDSARRLEHTAQELDAFQQEYNRAKKSYEITEQVNGNIFEITVKMPGRVVAHNGDKTGEDGAVTWEFSGEAFRDRPHEIMISSRIDNGKDTSRP